MKIPKAKKCCEYSHQAIFLALQNTTLSILI